MKCFESAAIGKRQLLYGSAAILALGAGPVLAQQAQQPEQQQDQGVTLQKDLQKEGPDVMVQQPPPAVTVEQPQPTVRVTQPPPEVTVKQPAPEIKVIMPEPQVTINQPKPDVQIEMPKPTVRVQQPDPNVQVNRAPPDVQVKDAQPQVQLQQSGQPKVQFQQAEQPKVTVQQAEPKVIVQRAQQQNQQLMSMTGKEVVGRQLVTSEGQQAGEIVDLVINKQNDRIFAVVDAGGAQAGAAKGVVVPLQQIQLDQGKLKTNQGMQQIKQATAYSEDQYQPIKLNVPISEFARFEAGQKQQ